MPELPEVEAARRAVEEHCLGKKIKKAIISNDSKVIAGVSPSDFESSLVGKTIVSVHRKGKNMWIQLDSPPFPSFQFGMTGAVYIKGVAVTKYKRSSVSETDEWPSKFSKFFIELDDGLELSFTDKRRLAKVRLLKDPTSEPPISELGPDASLEPMTADEFSESLIKKKIGIKAHLLDQSFISGIGNWIADEVLYQARIHPLQTAASLSKENCAALNKSIKEVILYAVKVDADSSCFPNEWLFHFRWGKKPGKVNGKEIDFIYAGGRTTAYVPELQKLSGAGPMKVIRESRKQGSKNKGGKAVDEDGNVVEAQDKEGEAIEVTKSKKGVNLRGDKKPVKKNSKRSLDDDDDDGDDDVDDDDDDDDDEDEKKSRKANHSKQAKAVKTPRRNITHQNSKKPKKKAK